MAFRLLSSLFRCGYSALHGHIHSPPAFLRSLSLGYDLTLTSVMCLFISVYFCLFLWLFLLISVHFYSPVYHRHHRLMSARPVILLSLGASSPFVVSVPSSCSSSGLRSSLPHRHQRSSDYPSFGAVPYVLLYNSFRPTLVPTVSTKAIRKSQH